MVCRISRGAIYRETLYRTSTQGGRLMPSTSSARRGIALIGGPVLAVLFATAVTAGPEGPRHAHGTFVDASGAAIGWLHLAQDARGVVHVNVQVEGLSPGLHGIH